MTLPRNLAFFCTFLFFQFSVFSQDGYTYVSQDFESWNTLSFKYKFNKKFKIGLDQGIRLNQNATNLDQIFTEFNFNFKPIPSLSFGSGLRYIADQGNNSLYDHDFRFNLDASFQHKKKPFSFEYRLRYQNRNEIRLSTDDGDYFKHYLRLKASATYSIKNWKFDPVFNAEIFRDMTRVTGGFDNLRCTFGTSYEFKKCGEIEGYYGFERTLGTSYPKTTFILGLNYTFTLKSKKYDN